MWSDASFRAYSSSTASSQRLTRKQILKTLYTDLPPCDASFLTQIILKDLRQLLYPNPGNSTAESLLSFKSSSVKMLSKEDAMNVWDETGKMGKAFAMRGTFREAASAFEGGEEKIIPIMGKNLQVSQYSPTAFHIVCFSPDPVCV